MTELSLLLLIWTHMEMFVFFLTCLLLQEVARCMLSKYSIYTAPCEHADSANATIVDGFLLPWQKTLEKSGLFCFYLPHSFRNFSSKSLGVFFLGLR